MATKHRTPRAQAVEVLDPAPQRQPVVRNHPIKLGTPDEMRLEMARVYREARSGTLDTQEASRLVYILGELRKAYETQVIDQRLKALENRP
ncbi:hypothetical protein [Sphaerotilus microaerophilus]|uniref:DUF1843 domain-containing protein n=1 Tax=Sphaerotilus microaerophilus TaxID=2914710 RepID=A0ABM7YRE0_9BURK|nr:hypothetical protein [Sphaerotilus sp. FB-5]BDI07138.1 hypothetical protein CATMQ487_41080 [Sphaerotilus sp. FB-5]